MMRRRWCGSMWRGRWAATSARSRRRNCRSGFSRDPAFRWTSALVAAKAAPTESAIGASARPLQNLPDQRPARHIQRIRHLAAFDRRERALRDHLAELDAPLVETVDAPQSTLRVHLALVQREQEAQRTRVETVEQDHVVRAI